MSEYNTILGQVIKIIEKALINQSCKLSNANFWPKPKMLNDAFTNLLNLELLCSPVALFLLQVLQKYKKFIKISKLRSLKETGAG